MSKQVAEIASRIAELRDILEITAEDMAAKLEIPVRDYMRYETAESDMPISVLYGVAAAMNVDPTVLISGEMPRMENYTLVRKGQGMHVERYKGYGFYSLAFNYKKRDMDPMLVAIKKSGEKQTALVSHAGQEFNYVLSGRVRVTLGKNEFVLNEGDSIYFDAAAPHGQSAETEEAVFLTVINENYIKANQK
jgi:mannose-6-phosphate isomerase-like protein (cupin superfamily)